MCKYTVFKRCHLNGGCYRWFILAPIKICYWPQSSKVQSLGDRASYAAIAIQRFEVSDEHTRGGSFWATILALTPLSNNCSLCVASEINCFYTLVLCWTIYSNVWSLLFVFSVCLFFLIIYLFFKHLTLIFVVIGFQRYTIRTSHVYLSFWNLIYRKEDNVNVCSSVYTSSIHKQIVIQSLLLSRVNKKKL